MNEPDDQEALDAEREALLKETEAARAKAEAQVHEARDEAHRDEAHRDEAHEEPSPTGARSRTDRGTVGSVTDGVNPGRAACVPRPTGGRAGARAVSARLGDPPPASGPGGPEG